jgi:DNA-directed RNA polymerase subunit RPC12/RpoP/DNA-directed RNA polymerase subunit M/transcription elongation factor TFIIS
VVADSRTSPNSQSAGQRFEIRCYQCERVVRALPDWIGREVRCPHCDSTMKVPEPRHDGQPQVAGRPKLTANRYFNFPCENCDSMLEGHSGISGRQGTCPTCGVRFEIPFLDARRNRVSVARLIDRDAQQEAPAPVHAYAASGDQAPEIIRGQDGSTWIQCPRCESANPMDASHCEECGTPFSLDGAATGTPKATNYLAVAALVAGVVSLPGFLLVLPGIAAFVLGLVAWNSARGRRRSSLALLGAGFGLISMIGAAAVWLWRGGL